MDTAETTSVQLSNGDIKTNSEGTSPFYCQVAILSIVIVACIINLSLGNGNLTLWTSLLSSSLGVLVPAPKLRKKFASS